MSILQVHVLQAQNIRIMRGARAIVDDVSLALRAGELTILIGPNGAGKTSLLRAMAGLIACSGEVKLDETPLARIPLQKRARAIAYLPQGHQFHWPMRVADIVALGRAPFSDAFGWSNVGDIDAIAQAARDAQIEDLMERSILSLSGGERARVAIARALATQARVLLADEPTAALDARHQLRVMDVLRKAARGGAAVFAVVHDLSLAARYADRLIMVQNGRLIDDGDAHSVLNEANINSVFGISMTRISTPHGMVLVPHLAQPDDNANASTENPPPDAA